MRWPWRSDADDYAHPERNLTAAWQRLIASQPEGHPEVKPPTARVEPPAKPKLLKMRKRKQA